MVIHAGGIQQAFPAVVSFAGAPPSLDRWHVVAFRPPRTPISIVKIRRNRVDPKSKKSVRHVEIPPKLADMLRELRSRQNGDSPFVFQDKIGRPLDPDGIYNVLHGAQDRSEVRRLGRARPQAHRQLRRSDDENAPLIH